MQCSVPGGQTAGVLSVHAVVVTVLFNAGPGRQLPLTAGAGHMLRKGTMDKREDDRHVGTLSISVHEDKENAAQPSSLESQNTRKWQNCLGTGSHQTTAEGMGG